MRKKERGYTAVLLLTVLVINFLSLVYQVVWTRKIMVLFGTSALSISTVLSVFLAGIAIGGYYGGRWIRRVKRKYLFCGSSLVVLGVYCLLSLYVFGLVKYPFFLLSGLVESPLAINLVKFFLSALILIFPTIIIGAMFPVVTYLYSVEFKRLGRDVASIYSLDTLGAAIGAALSGFLFVPVLGLAVTSAASAVLYIAVGLAVARMEEPTREYELDGPEAGPGAAEEADPPGPAPGGAWGLRTFVLVSLFVSGFSALVLEVTWSRFFHLLFGTSIYAFALVVSAFLAGLSVGSYVIKRLHDRIGSPVTVFAYVMLLVAGFSIVVVQASDQMEALYMYLYHATSDFYVFQALLFLAAFALMLVPTSLMGANFPLAVRIFASTREARGRDTGLIFSVNTAGGIIGAFAAGFFIIPALGIEKTGFLAAACYFTIGVVFLLAFSRKAVHAAAAAALLVVFAGFGAATYGEPDLGISVYYNGIRKKSYEDYARIKKNANIVFARHGLYGLVAVEKNKFLNNTALWINGKVDASTARNDMQNQDFLGQLPLLFHRRPEKVLNIGFGSGVTAGAVASHRDVKLIDCVELDPLVVEAASRYFADENNNVTGNPRVRVHYEDGRHFLYTTKEKYDVIISEPSNIWISGVSQLFTREFYRIADEHLNEDGIFTQWLPAYDLVREDFDLVLNTLDERFEHIMYWTNRTDIILLASHEPLTVDYGYVARHMREREVVEDIAKGLDNPNLYTTAALLEEIVATETLVPEYIRDFSLVNTDDRNILEFHTVRNSYARGHRTARR
ncbi:MAG: fused MFS/spermidine synthase [Thermodesulfobacteriota bacterium]